MSDSIDMLLSLSPLGSSLQRADNPLRVVLDRTVGEWLDEFEQPFEQLFLTSATGGWLDAHGRDYGVPRKINEDDDTYRQRIIYEKLDHLTPALLSDVYNVRLFTYRSDFDVKSNTLVSDNPHIVFNDSFLGVSDEDTISILDKKFIVDSTVTWINDIGTIDYIFDTRGINILPAYKNIYNLTQLSTFFKGNMLVEDVQLYLPTAEDCRSMFMECAFIKNVNLNLPNATRCQYMFEDCTVLEKVNLIIPKATSIERCFDDCSALTEVNMIADATRDSMNAFQECSALIDVDLDLPNCSTFTNTFWKCTNLKNVKLNAPKFRAYYGNMFNNCPNIETININIPVSEIDAFKSYVTGLNLQHLTSFKINGEEQL